MAQERLIGIGASSTAGQYRGLMIVACGTPLMRFLGIGDYCDLSSLYLRLLAEGHEVKVYIAKELCQDVLTGLVTHVDEWRNELAWIREAGDEGIVLFEDTAEHRGQLQDQMRLEGLHVIGGSAYGDKLENDRGYGQSVLK